MSEESKQRTGFWKSFKGRIVVLTAFGTALVAFLANVQRVSDFFDGIFSSKKIIISGTILNDDKTPAGDAHVAIYLSYRKDIDSLIIFSNKEGQFNFKNVKTKYDSFTINAYWKGKSASYKKKFSAVDLENDIVITLANDVLPSNSNPLSFSYFNLRGNIIDYLLEGKVDSSWEVKLSKYPYIIGNIVFNTVKQLREKFNYISDKKEKYVFSYLDNGEGITDIKVRNRLQYYMANSDDQVRSDELIQLNEKDVSLFVKDNRILKKLQTGDTSFSWFPTRNELIELKKAQLKFLKKNLGYNPPENYNEFLSLLLSLTEEYYPEHFVEAQVTAEGCGEGWFVVLSHITLSLKIALIENPTTQTLTLGNIFVKEKMDSLRLNNVELDSTSELKNYNYFPKGKLKPNETIVLPLQLIIENSDAKEFAYGTSQSLESIEVNNDNYAVRKESTKNLLIYDGTDGGSCPYIYSFSKSTNDWVLENHILYGFRSKEKEKEHVLLLRRFNGQLQIREKDPETSYIDYLYVKHILPNGEIKILKSTNLHLREKDGDYLVLKKGSKLLLNFPSEENTKGSYLVISYGYYIPYN